MAYKGKKKSVRDCIGPRRKGKRKGGDENNDVPDPDIVLEMSAEDALDRWAKELVGLTERDINGESNRQFYTRSLYLLH